MANDFLFHKISEKERETIRKQAKKIMDDFSNELLKVKMKIDDSPVEISDGQTEESFCKNSCSEIDRKIMFENAPNKSGDFVIAESGKW